MWIHAHSHDYKLVLILVCLQLIIASLLLLDLNKALEEMLGSLAETLSLPNYEHVLLKSLTSILCIPKNIPREVCGLPGVIIWNAHRLSNMHKLPQKQGTGLQIFHHSLNILLSTFYQQDYMVY